MRAHAEQRTPRKKRSPRKTSLQTRREAERREAHPPGRIEKRCGARPFSCLPTAGRPRPRTSLSLGPHGAGALAFRRPTAASEVLASARLRPRFLEPPDANGRTLSGTSAASTSRSDTCRTGRCPSRPRAQCIATPTKTAPAPPQGVPSRKASLCERDVGLCNCNRNKVKGDVALLGTAW